MGGAARDLEQKLSRRGIAPTISHAIGQVAYTARRNRAAWIPDPIVGMAEVTWIADHYQKLLQHADSQHTEELALTLCRRIFGDSEGVRLYSAAIRATFSPGRLAQDVNDVRAKIDHALTHFDTIDVNFVGDNEVTVPAVKFVGSVEKFEGFILAGGGMMGFFADSHTHWDDETPAAPIIYPLASLHGCAISVPASIYLPKGLDRLEFHEPAKDFHASLGFRDLLPPLKIAIRFDHLQEDQRHERANDIEQLMYLLNKGLSQRGM